MPLDQGLQKKPYQEKRKVSLASQRKEKISL